MKTGHCCARSVWTGVVVAAATAADPPYDFTWDPGSSGFTWSSAANWDGPGSRHPDDSYDRAIFSTAAGNPELTGDVDGNIGGGLGRLDFTTAGWAVNNEPGGDYTLFLNSVTYFGYNAIFSAGAGVNALHTKLEFVGAAQNVYTATGNTLVIGRGFTGSYGPVISSVNPTAEDTGAVRLDAASSVTGAFYLRQGTLLVRHSSGLGTAGTLAIGGDEFVSDGANARLLTDASGITISPNITVRTSSGHEVNATLGGRQTAGASTFAGTITLQRDARLTAANTDGSAVTFANTISGAGGITKIGAGMVVLGHANTFDGAVAVNAGILRLGASGALPADVPVTLANTAGAGLDLNGLSHSVASLSGGGTSGGSVALGAATLTVGAGTYSGTISGAGGLTKDGPGTFTLSGQAAYGGATVVNAGTLAYGAGNVLPGGPLTVNGASAVLDLGPYSDTVGAVTLDGGGRIDGTGSLTSTAAFELHNGTVNAGLGGAVGLNKTTAGTVTLAGAGAFSGTTRPAAGTLRLGHDLALQNSTVDLRSGDTGVLDLNGRSVTLGGLTGTRDLAIPDKQTLRVGNNGASTTYSGEVTGVAVSLVKQGAGTLTLDGTSTFTGLTRIEAGTLSLGGGGTSGSVRTPVENHGLLRFNRSDALVFDNPIGGTGGLQQVGGGTVTLSADNTYSGGTTVTRGTLLVEGRHAGGGLYTVGGVVATRAVLGGNGRVGSSVNVLPGGEVSPGTSVGQLTVEGDVLLGGTLRIQLDPSGAGDVLLVGGSLDLQKAAVVFEFAGAPDDESYVFVSYGALTGAPFASVLNIPPGYWLDYDYQGLQQIALVVPEPPSRALLVTGALLFFARRLRRLRPGA